MPAFQGVPNIDTIIFHINDIQRAMLVADATKITLIPINDWRHDFSLSGFYLNSLLARI
jgi:hypothetical protein